VIIVVDGREKSVKYSLVLPLNIKLEVQVAKIDNVDCSVVSFRTIVREKKVIKRTVRRLRSSGDYCGG